MKCWYLLYCKRSEQQRAEQGLLRQVIECYYPQVLEPLFPNYVFANFDPENIAFTTVRSTRGVIDFVRQGPMPAVLDTQVVSNLQAHEQSGEQQERGSLSDLPTWRQN